ncbi:alpha/beta hydrolase [Cupriavidus taiwanensis]|uniref:Putative Esterase/lipase n=1 Tax=Cupriavidus taiwanensis TaxID=164546 RepID=A0A7Z7JC46_9BURK|nr:alpha/beta hydrolase [Cupriavidus taiwanensis]SOY88969.1 putative Esterase/lipase [Cupriavidus taiwanensis]SOZ03059.1 putative Esterase/lipase [Cupriavidus taiwanensis]SOZ06334.1 putative Esterase/lipase [Cupriavidus taiwanensis]SPC18865.1 putative Esterase/lipase [Cupriavidus taiwanensis]SPD41289.1 putative Esterase/lipase [Cupriavidus taiwanensis]
MTDPDLLARLASLPSQDPAFYDSEYNNRANVPDNPAHLARWAQWSAQVRARGHFLADLSYAGAGSRHASGQTLDYFPARRANGALPPLLVFVHGGYYRALDKHDHSFVASALPALGVSVAVVNYTLVPAATVPEIVRQVLCSVAWLYRQSDRLGHDAQRLFVAGHSVGGHLVAMLMAARWPQLGADLPAGLIRGGLSVSGLYDLEPLRRAAFLQCDLQLSEADVARLSPAYMAPAGDAPLAIAVGELEAAEYHRQHALIRAAWPAKVAHPAASDLVLPGCHHFNVLDSLASADGALTRAVLRLMER